MKVLLTISYDGTGYCGWQRQGRGELTVQKVIEDAITDLYGAEVSVLGASRTDSGVHAYGQRASFIPPNSRISTDKLHLAINARLPNDVRVLSACEKEDFFHVINDVKSKTYNYKIENSGVYNPLMSRFVHHVREPLNLAYMREAASYFVGEHDFKAFCASHSGAKTTVRTIYSFDITKEDDIFRLTVSGNGFLYNMIRIIAGTLIDVGAGKMKPNDIFGIINSKKRENAGKTASAKGLVLLEIVY